MQNAAVIQVSKWKIRYLIYFFTAIQTNLKIKTRRDEKDYCIDNNNNLKVHQKKYLSFRYAVKLQKWLSFVLEILPNVDVSFCGEVSVDGRSWTSEHRESHLFFEKKSIFFISWIVELSQKLTAGVLEHFKRPLSPNSSTVGCLLKHRF